MSNTRRPKWTDAQVTAANAETLLGEVWDEAEVVAYARVITRKMLEDLASRGHAPELLAEFARAAAAMSFDEWAGLRDHAREIGLLR